MGVEIAGAAFKLQKSEGLELVIVEFDEVGVQC